MNRPGDSSQAAGHSVAVLGQCRDDYWRMRRTVETEAPVSRPEHAGGSGTPARVRALTMVPAPQADYHHRAVAVGHADSEIRVSTGPRWDAKPESADRVRPRLRQRPCPHKGNLPTKRQPVPGPRV